MYDRCLATLTALAAAGLAAPAIANITPIELAPVDVGSGSGSIFTVHPTDDLSLFFGFDPGENARRVDFNTAPDGPLVEGGNVTDQYASAGVTMNGIRVSASIYGGNQYGPGFAAEDDQPQIYTFTVPVRAVGIVNTSPDRDLVQFWSGPDGTGTLLLEFRDQAKIPSTPDIDRFVGGIAAPSTAIRSFTMSNTAGNLELDEMIFVVDPDFCLGDLDGDGSVAFEDVLDLLAAWGPVVGDGAADLDCDGQIGLSDLLLVLAAWGPC